MKQKDRNTVCIHTWNMPRELVQNRPQKFDQYTYAIDGACTHHSGPSAYSSTRTWSGDDMYIYMLTYKT